MSGLKNILKSDTPTSGRKVSTGLGGQGSHFPKDDNMSSSIATGPTTVTGTQGQTAGAADASAAAPPVSQAAATSGPEAGGQEHVGTISSSAAPATQSSTDHSAMATSTQGDLPQAERRAESGTAAIGETTTYSSRPLATGDPVGSIVDHESTDPLTYKLPEHTRATESTSLQSPAGTTSSAAAAAASAAWATHNTGERMPGEYPSAGYENPYKATHALDPRVDGGKLGDPVESSPSTAAPAAAAAVPSTSETPTADTQATGPPPSTLTTAVDPTERSAEYQGAVADKGLDSTATPATGTGQAESAEEQQGIAGKVLGSLGIGSAAAAAAGYLGYGKKSEATDEPHDTSAIATQPAVPSQETGPPKHYRRESIPTTAYPAGPKSPAALAPPVGGTQPLATSAETQESGVTTSEPGRSVHDQTTTGSESNTSRYTITGGAAAAGAAGAGAYALHEHKEAESIPATAAVSDTPATVGDATATSSTPATGATSTVPDRTKDAPIDAVAAAPGRLEGQDAQPSASSALAQEPEKKEEDHTGRNAALGAGAGAAVAGGAYAAHEKSERDAAQEAAEREKELAKQREAQQKEAAKAEKERQKEAEKQEKQHQKEVEKEQKKAEKEAEKEQKKAEKEAEKEEKKHQKELAKEEKLHEKELEKEEKEKQAALAAAEQREKARIASEDEDRMRKEREAAAGVGTAAFTGAGMTAHEKEHEAEGQEKKKKPNIFKRIFKRRKNKDTGEDEEYSTDDEEDKAAKEGRVPTHHSESKDRNVLGAGAATGAGAAAAGSTATENRDSVTGLEYDPEKDPAAAARLARDPSAASDTHGRGLDAAPAGAAVENPPPAPMKPEDFPVEHTTGMPYDPSKDPAAAARLDAAAELAGARGTTGEASATTSGGVDTKSDSMSEPFGVIGDHKR